MECEDCPNYIPCMKYEINEGECPPKGRDMFKGRNLLTTFLEFELLRDKVGDLCVNSLPFRKKEEE